MAKTKKTKKAKKSKKLKYSLLVQWSDEDKCYVVFSPEWEHYPGPITDGNTYEEAAAHGQNALESMISHAQENGEPLPQPRTFAALDDDATI